MKSLFLAKQGCLRFLVVLVVLFASLSGRAFDNGINDLHGGTPAPPGTSPPPPPPPPPPPCDPNKCPPDPNCSAGDPVYPANGKFYLQLTDYELGGEIPITIRRLYSTMFAYNGFYGYGWNLSYNERLYRLANGSLLLRRDNDTRDEFANSAPRTYRAPAGKYETITENLDGTYTLRRVDGTIQVYNNDGTLAKIEDLRGYQLLFTYDPAGKWPINGIPSYSHLTNPIVIARDYRLIRIDQAKSGVANGRATAFRYDADGRMTNITILAGNTPPLNLFYTYANNGRGDLLNYTDVKGTLFSYAYDQLHRMTNFPTAECACRSGQNIYDANHRVTRQLLGGTIVDFEYLVANTQTRVTTHIFDDQTQQPLRDRIEYFNFTASGKTARHVLQMGRALDPAQGETDDIVTTYRYHAVTDELLGVDEPAGGRRAYTYDAAGNVAAEVITNGTEIITRVSQYDLNNRLTNLYVTSTLWPGVRFGQRAASFDASGRVLAERRIGTNGAELVTTYQYQPAGDHEIVTVTDPEGNRMARETDAKGKLLREFDPDFPAYQTRYEYDDRGNLTNRIDALGYQTHYAYDDLNRLVRERDALGHENLFAYAGPNLVREEFGRSGALSGRTALHDYNANNKRIATYRAGDGATNLWMRYAYDSDGNLIWDENALGHRTTYDYDAAGRPVVIGDVYGGLTTNSYDKAGNLISSRNPLGFETRLQYDRLNRLTNRLEGVGSASQRQAFYRFDPTGNQIETLWPDGTSTFYGHDGWRRMAQVSGTRELPASYQYDGNDRRIVATDGNGFSTTNRHDRYGRLTDIVHPDGAVEHFQYDLVGNMTAWTDGNTNTTYFSYDGLHRQVRETPPNSPGVMLFTNVYNSWNELILRSNALAGTERRSYDAFGRLTNNTDAAGLSLTLHYDAANRLSAVVWPNGSFVSNSYSGALLAAARDRAGRWTAYGHDLLGRRAVEVTPHGLTNTFAYDALGRLTSRSNSLRHVFRTDYDVFDNPTRITEPDGLAETVMYDLYGQVTNRLGPGRYPVTFQYDAAGNRTNQVDGNGNRTGWVYDSRKRVGRATYADGSFFEYDYDRNGNLRTRRNAEGIATTYSFNAANHLTRVDYLTDPDVLFQTDALGRRTQMVDGAGTNRWFYDAAGRVRTNTQGRASALVAYEYDVEGNRTSMSVNGFETRYIYDTAGRLAGLSNTVGVFTCVWNPAADWVEAVSCPGGAVVSNSYNRLGWLTERRNLKTSGAAISTFAYNYDSVGMRTNAAMADGTSRAYAYDSVRQLTGARGLLPGGASDPNYQYGYTYDAVGNRRAATNNAVAIDYSVNSLNQYAASVTPGGPLTTNAFTHDLNGNLVRETPSGPILYRWDSENRLAAVTNGTHRSEFVYNGMGFRVESREYENGVLQQTTRHVYDGALPIADVDGLNAPLRDYVRGLDLTFSLEAAGGIGGLLALADRQTSSVSLYFSDGNGNVVDLVAVDGSPSAHYDYDPFGGVLAASGPLASQPFQWSSKRFHPASGLSDYGYRSLKASVGRWISRDPILEPGFRILTETSRRATEQHVLAPYVFVANNPVSSWDYLGLDNPGCDIPEAVRDSPAFQYKRDCYLRCCAQHDACYLGNRCTWLSWGLNVCQVGGRFGGLIGGVIGGACGLHPCARCNNSAVACFARCTTGIFPPKGPRWFCPNGPNKGKFYDNYDDIPASCWEDGKKPCK